MLKFEGRTHPIMRLRNMWRIIWGPAIIAFYLLGKLIPRDPRLWVFGNRKSFGDNSRYLMEYIRVHVPEIRLVWLARKKETRDQAREQGFTSHLVTSPRGIAVAFRAGVGIVCDGLGDINRAALGGLRVVHLFHGTPLKKLRLDAPVTWTVGSGVIGRISNAMSAWMMKRVAGVIDLMVATSPRSARDLASAFGLPLRRIRVTGTPRADIILGREKDLGSGVTSCREQLGLDEGARIVLYAPTWREYSLDESLWSGFDSEQWSACLSRHGAYLLVKLHPHTPRDEELARVSSSRRIIVLGADICNDCNVLLREVDVLISDYSSVVFDFSLLVRPIVFFAPDRERYSAVRGFYEPYRSVTSRTECDQWTNVVDAVARCLKGEDEDYRRVAEQLRKRYNTFRDTENRRRIVQAIWELIEV